jgi:hypothetical protein
VLDETCAEKPVTQNVARGCKGSAIAFLAIQDDLLRESFAAADGRCERIHIAVGDFCRAYANVGWGPAV